jgi:hypothetical protein
MACDVKLEDGFSEAYRTKVDLASNGIQMMNGTKS